MLGGEERKLCLTIGGLMDVESEVGVGILKLAGRFSAGDVGFRDVAPLLHHAVLGGGGDFTFEEVGAWIVEAGLSNLTEPCLRLLGMAIAGPPEALSEGNGDAPLK